jgi:hypothetical protein
MTPADPTNFSSNLISERYLCVEWAYTSGLITKLSATHPLIRIDRMTVRQYLDRAIGYLVQEGVALRSIWGLADLVEPEAFKKIIDAALSQSPAAAQCMALVLLTTAREWLNVDLDHLAQLETASNHLPGIATDRRRAMAAHRLARNHATTNSGRHSALKHPA